MSRGSKFHFISVFQAASLNGETYLQLFQEILAVDVDLKGV